MDFLEEYIINNKRVPNHSRWKLFMKEGMWGYNFMGCLSSLTNLEHCLALGEDLTSSEREGILLDPLCAKMFRELWDNPTVYLDEEDEEIMEEIIDLFEEEMKMM